MDCYFCLTVFIALAYMVHSGSLGEPRRELISHVKRRSDLNRFEKALSKRLHQNTDQQRGFEDDLLLLKALQTELGVRAKEVRSKKRGWWWSGSCSYCGYTNKKYTPKPIKKTG